MPIFERPPLETLAMARDRWTPVYLEHGRLEVDDSSVKWISADGLLCRIPAATVSAILLGTGHHDYACSGESLCRLEHSSLLDRRRRNALLRHWHYADTR